MSRTGCHDACRALARAHARSCAGWHFWVGFLRDKTYVKVLTQREYKFLCLIQECLGVIQGWYMCDSRE